MVLNVHRTMFTYLQPYHWLPVFGIFKVRTDVDASDCTQGGCTDTVRQSAMEVEKKREKILAAPGTRTRVSFAPG